MHRRGSIALRLLISFLVIAVVVGARVWNRSSRNKSGSNNPNVAAFAKDDRAMNDAITRSRQNVTIFIEHLAHPKAGETDFAVKVPVRDGGNTEHFWLANTTFDGTRFHGAIDDEPAAVGNVKKGQTVDCLPADISDWMYAADNRLIGGETIRVARNKMSAAERAAFDRQFPYRLN